jgi:perosamine synthetase
MDQNKGSESGMIRLTVPDIGEEDLAAVQDVLKSGYLVQGIHVKTFEQAVADYLGVSHAVAVSSCTAALHLTLVAMGIGQGDEVIVPDFTFPATVNVVELVGAKPVFCDIQRSSFCIDSCKLEKLITHNTRALIPVHEFGHPAEMDKIMAIAERFGLLVIEDAACALGAEFRGKKAGTFGATGCFSFHPRKAVTTGEGGIIATSDAALAERTRCLRNHGMTNENGRIEFVAAGFNYRMTDLQGALGVVQMKKLPELIEKRINLAALYDHSFDGVDFITTPSCAMDCRHVYQTYHILLDEQIDRNKLIKTLRENGIETNYGAYAVHMQKYYGEKYGSCNISCPVSSSAFLHGVALPLHPGLTVEDILVITDAIKSGCRSTLIGRT